MVRKHKAPRLLIVKPFFSFHLTLCPPFLSPSIPLPLPLRHQVTHKPRLEDRQAFQTGRETGENSRIKEADKKRKERGIEVEEMSGNHWNKHNHGDKQTGKRTDITTIKSFLLTHQFLGASI